MRRLQVSEHRDGRGPGQPAGITKGLLVTKIDQMAAEGLLREVVKEAAHEVRLVGNDMAHGDVVDPISTEDASDVLTLMGAVLDDVYGITATTNRLRQRGTGNQPNTT